MNNQYKLDIALGNTTEQYIKNVIKSHFNIPTLLKLSKFHTFDFYGNDIYFEVKARRNNHDKYESIMIGYNKFEYIRQNDLKEVYFIFVFQDGNFYYKYNDDDELETGICGRNDRNKYEYKKYIYIPVSKLVKL
jgi:hypothetical protein